MTPTKTPTIVSVCQSVSVCFSHRKRRSTAKTRQSTDWWWKWRRRQRSCHRCRWQYPCPKSASWNICSQSTWANAFFQHLNQPSKDTFLRLRSFCWWLCHTRFTRMHDTTEEHYHEKDTAIQRCQQLQCKLAWETSKKAPLPSSTA